ncbi:DUF6527 family protein [Sediminibacterium sp.]|uniref:DUF6527 family protein n=1 Tax=Sediminibacterium sp. TaxID=1917865 RepID=UPI00272EEF63|nr:DUF6527 family protein [Sediminibacterium sp.]MDP2421335.1 DUF6527 family protein [Sediminibacterium sp.]
MKWIKWIIALFRKRTGKWKIKDCSEIPDKIQKGTIYKIYNKDICWQMLMECPCGCNTLLYLNALPDYKPNWRLSTDKSGEISIQPSIHRKEGCCSHFFIKESRVLWV